MDRYRSWIRVQAVVDYRLALALGFLSIFIWLLLR